MPAGTQRDFRLKKAEAERRRERWFGYASRRRAALMPYQPPRECSGERRIFPPPVRPRQYQQVLFSNFPPSLYDHERLRENPGIARKWLMPVSSLTSRRQACPLVSSRSRCPFGKSQWPFALRMTRNSGPVGPSLNRTAPALRRFSAIFSLQSS